MTVRKNQPKLNAITSTGNRSDFAGLLFNQDRQLTMLAKRIIPCLDVHAGRVVKGVNFLNLQDAGDPVAIASRYEAEGADE